MSLGKLNLADQSIYDIYDLAVDHFESGVFVELGCLHGASTLYLANKIKEHKRDIILYAIDIWENMIAPGVVGSNFPIFWNNVMEAECEQIIRPIQFDSRFAAYAFSDVDFVFIDADHRYRYVKADIINWLDSIKEHGWIAGHDYNQEVERAVRESFRPEQIESFDHGCRSFLVRL